MKQSHNKSSRRQYWQAGLLILALAALFIGVCAGSAVAGSRGISLTAAPKTPQLPFTAGRYRALVVGNDDYRDPEGRWPDLRTAVAGARAMADLLKNRYGFDDVVLLENATRREILIALNELSREVLPNDNILVYYAGHGFLDPDTQRGYWVPVDAAGTDLTTFLRNSTIRDELNTIAARGRHTLLIADSCFSGSLLRSGTRGLPPAVDSDRYYQKVAQKKSVQIMAAGGIEYVDDDYKASGHSPFTHFLLSELKYNDRPLLTVSELSQNVEKAVANNVQQVPESGVLQGAGDELGEFIFIDITVSGVAPERVRVRVRAQPGSQKVSPAPTPTAPLASPAPLPMPTL